MSVKLNPYLNFQSSARAAMEFYKTVFGGTLTLTTFQDGGMSLGPADAQLVMHSQLEARKNATGLLDQTFFRRHRHDAARESALG
jgi:PhnB protein